MKKVLIIIPAYNEEERIAGVVLNVRQELPTADIVVVNDGSSDNTSRVAKAAGAKVINLPFNLGYGAALQTGYKYAVANEYEYVVQMDGDGQHDPRDVRALLDGVKADSADVTIGSRFLEGRCYPVPFIRRMGMRIFAWFASAVIGQKVTDATSGYQALNRRVVEFYCKEFYPWDYPDADMIITLHLAGLRIKEIPVRMYPGPDDKSMHSGLKPVYYVFKMFLSMFICLLGRYRGERQ